MDFECAISGAETYSHTRVVVDYMCGYTKYMKQSITTTATVYLVQTLFACIEPTP